MKVRLWSMSSGVSVIQEPSWAEKGEMWKNCWADVGEVKRERRVVARTSDERAGDLVVVMGMYIMLGE